MELEQPEAAARFYESLALTSPGWPNVFYPLAQAFEQMGDEGKARTAYASFIDAWKDADPELQPWVQQAREALERLGPLDQ